MVSYRARKQLLMLILLMESEHSGASSGEINGIKGWKDRRVSILNTGG